MAVGVFLAGLVHWILILVSFALPGKLKYPEHLKKLPPILRQLFRGQHYLIIIVLLFFGAICVFFPTELTEGEPLGTSLCAGMGVFWFFRLMLQLFYYDPKVRREHRLGDLAYIAVFVAQSAVFLLAALGVGP